MLEFDTARCAANVHSAADEDLLDRATVFRSGLEPEAVPIIEAELRRRGITPRVWADHAEGRSDTIVEGGLALKCIDCHRPAVSAEWGWHKLWGVIPLFPRRLRRCRLHLPNANGHQDLSSG